MFIRALLALSVSLLFSGAAVAADYHIGPGQTYSTIAAAPWSSLVAGDNVYIHAKPALAPYYEHLYLSAKLQGTQSSPINIIGVADGSGNKPVLDGTNATTGTNFDTYYTGAASPANHSMLGLIVFGPSNTGGYGSYPQWVNVSNLTVQNYCANRGTAGTCSTSTTAEDGAVQTVVKGSGVYIQSGKHIVLDNLTINNHGDGIFAKDNASYPTQYITVRNCNIFGNGVANETGMQTHNTYTEVKYLTFEGNHFGPTITGSPGNNVKDRSAGFVFRNNWVDGGQHLIDIVECQDNCADHTTDAAWNNSFVYNNTFYAGPGAASQLFHLGTGDTGATASYWRKNLYFYHNTVHLQRNQSQSYYSNIFQMSGTQQTIYLDNNIFYTSPATVGQPAPEIYLQYDGSVSPSAYGNLIIGKNWLNPGWSVTKPTVTVTGTVTGTSNLLSSGSPVFVNLAAQDYHIASGSAAIGMAGALPSLISSGNWTGTNLTPAAGTSDLGAYPYTGTPPVTPTTTRVFKGRFSGKWH